MNEPKGTPPPETSKGAGVARNAAFLTLGQVAARAIGAAWLIFLARYLGTSEYGTYTLATSFVGFVAVVSDLGIGLILLRRIVQEPDQAPGLVGAGVSLVGVLSCAAVALAVGLTVGLGYGGRVLLISTIASLAIIPNAVGSVALVIVQSRNRFGVFAGFILVNLVLSIGIGTLILLLGGGVLGLVGAILVAAILTAVGAWAVALRIQTPSFRSARPYLRPLLFAALPIGVAAYGQSAAFQVDNLMIGHTLSLTVLAFYDVAFMFYSSAVEVFFTPLIGVTFPLLSRVAVASEAQLRRVLRRTFGLTLAVLAPITVGGALLSTRLVRIVFGSRYLEGGPVLTILVLALVPTAYWGTITKMMIIRGRHARYMVTFAGLLGFAAGGVWIGLHLHGLKGAAMGVLAAHLATASLAGLLMREYAWIVDGRAVKVAVAAAIMGVVVWLIHPWPTILVMALGAGVYGILAVALRILDADDRKALMEGLLGPLLKVVNAPKIP